MERSESETSLVCVISSAINLVQLFVQRIHFIRLYDRENDSNLGESQCKLRYYIIRYTRKHNTKITRFHIIYHDCGTTLTS